MPVAILDFVSLIIKFVELSNHFNILNSEPLQILFRPLLDVELN